MRCGEVAIPCGRLVDQSGSSGLPATGTNGQDGPRVILAVDPDWMGHGLHEVGEEVACAIGPEQAYVLPPDE